MKKSLDSLGGTREGIGGTNSIAKFNVSLTVHHAMILDNCPT